ncbi:hypothetical protein JCM8547_003800 [Rhodosporidiobolus lusitaniae]
MSSSSTRSFETLLVLYPLEPPILDSLRTVFPRVLYYPSQGPSCPPDAPLPSAEEWKTVDAIFTFALPDVLTSLEQVPRLKLVQGCSAGYSHLEQCAFYKSLPSPSPVTFANASGIHVSTIGEHCLATVLMLYHKLHTIAIRNHVDQRWIAAHELGGNFIRELNTLKVGIVGYGHIGRETARLFHACGSTVYALTRSGRPTPIHGFLLPHTGDPLGTLPQKYFASIDRSARLDFFGACDVVINTLPDSVRTRGCMGVEELSAMKGDSVYVNIGRGTTTDQEALVEALSAQPQEGEAEDAVGTLRIGGASLDVTEPEPLPPSHPLFLLPNVLVTPHMSGSSKLYWSKATEVLKVNVERMRKGKGAVNAWHGRGEEA